MEENKKEFDIEEKEVIEENTKKKSAKSEFLEWIQAIVIAVVLALIIRSFVFTVVRVDGQSMEPTLTHKDRMIFWRVNYEPVHGDIVIFNPEGYDDNVYWVKRVIGTEGQNVRIDYSQNAVYVDGEKIDEPYLGEPMIGQGTIREIDIPEDHVFVMGDNRNHSTDGRIIGAIPKDSIIGRAVVRFWPMNEFKIYTRK